MVLAQAARSRCPSVGPLNDPAARKDLEGGQRSEERKLRALPDAGDEISAGNDLDVDIEPALELDLARAVVAGIDEDLLDRRRLLRRSVEDVGRRVSVEDVRRRDENSDDEPEDVGGEMALAPIYFFRAVETMDPPFSAVRTDWLSMTVAVGSASLPSRSRHIRRKRSFISSK